MKKITLFIISFLSLFTVNAQVLINEFEPNQLGPGSDPANQNIELKGSPNTAFSGTIISVEGDNNTGIIERVSNVSGTFDANGILVVNIPDLENPSFTLILLSSFSGSVNDVVNIPTISPNVLDAIGIPDNNADEPFLIADELGGINTVAPNTTEPTLVFRDSVDNAIYVVVSGNIFNADGDLVDAGEFDGDPTTPSFGIVNSRNENAVLSTTDINAKELQIGLYPNPVNTNTNIVNIVTTFNGVIEANIYDISGKKALSALLKNKTINIQNLSAGVYIVQLSINNKKSIIRLVVR